MGERIQPGGRVDEQVYEDFRDFVERQHGQVRGSLGDELEIAMRERMNGVDRTDRLQRIEDDVAHLVAMVADSDGGMATPAPAADGRTHTQTGDGDHDPDDPPHAKSSTQAKRDWLTAEVRRRATDGVFSEPAIRKIIDDTWGFDDRTAEPMADAVIDRLGAGYDDENGNPDRLVWD
jgi:hypothetical protein